MQRRAGITTAGVIGLAASVLAGPSRPEVPDGAEPLQQAPAYQVDPLWPKPLPAGWILGSVMGITVDAQDHIWIVHRGADSLTARTEMGLGTDPPTAEYCCRAAPPVLEFDASGTLLAHWGGPGQGYDWPASPGGIAVDPKGNVGITAGGWPEPAAPRGGGAGARGGRAGGAAGAAPAAAPPAPRHDAHLLKFSRTGQFLQQIGKPGASEGSASQTTFNRPAHLAFDAAANELYVADGHGHRRIVVLDATSGAYKRHWGAYGAPPEDAPPPPYDPAAPPSKQFSTVSCVAIARDGLVYVCDRQHNRIQVFRKNGTFVKEAIIGRATRGNGAVWSVAFSADAGQRYLFVADGQNHRVVVLERDTLAEAGTIGGGGRWPGAFYAVSGVAVDSRGNLYTAEAFEGKRVQKFLPRR